MAKMIAVYKTPKDKAAFEEHYNNVHIPLAKQLPGLQRYEINEGGIMSTTGHTGVYKIATLYFESVEKMMAAFTSDIGKKCAEDRKILASDEDVQIYVFDTKDAY